MNFNRIAQRVILTAIGSLSVLAGGSAAETLPSAQPATVGLSQERLDRIHGLVEKRIAAGEITGAVMLVARKGQIAYVDVQGTQDVETKAPMRRDSVFRLASMTKPVIGTAIMMMLEEGKLRLDDPVSRFIPEFKNQQAAVLQAAATDDTPLKFYTVPAVHDITIKELLTQDDFVDRRIASVLAPH